VTRATQPNVERGRAKRAAAFVCSIGLACGVAVAFASPVEAEWVDTGSAGEVRQLYDAVWRRVDPSVGWTGSTENCDPGSVGPDLIQQSIERINAYRSLAGVDASVRDDPALSAPAQAAAMLMSVNSALSHSPPPTWRCYSAQAATGAASSNLYLGLSGVGAIDGYMVDPGSNNTMVGHRWWILRPGTQRMGIGSTNNSQALWVTTTDHSQWSVRDPRGIIAWPPAGYIPTSLVPPRWSVMTHGIDMSAAEVTVRDAGGSVVPTVVEARSSDRIVFVPSDQRIGARRQLTSSGSTDFSVEVRTPTTTYAYVVRLLDTTIGSLNSLTPHRLVDTRSDLGLAGIMPHVRTSINVRTLGALPATATAIVANVTVVDPASAGFVSVTDCEFQSGTPTSSLNFAQGETRANLVAVPLSRTGDICVTSTSRADLLVDIAGYYSAQGQGYVPLTPARIADTRNAGVRVERDQPLVVQVAGQGGVPFGATSVTMNVTATEPVATGFLTVWPCDSPLPVVSNVNYVANQSVPNLATVRLDPSGRVCIHAEAAAHVIVDVAGYTLE